MAETIASVKTKKGIALDKANEKLEEAKQARDEAQAAFEADSTNEKLKKALEKAKKAYLEAGIDQQKAQAAVNAEKKDAIEVESNGIENSGSQSWNKLTAFVKQHWKKGVLIAATVAVAVTAIATPLGIENSTHETLDQYNKAQKNASNAINEANEAYDYAVEIFNQALEAKTADEARKVLEKAGYVSVESQIDGTLKTTYNDTVFANADVVREENAESSAFDKAQAAKKITAESKGELDTVKEDLDKQHKTSKVKAALNNIGVLLADTKVPDVTFDSESFQVTPKNAINVNYTVKADEQGEIQVSAAKARVGEIETVEVSSVVDAGKIADNATAFARFAAQIAQDKLNEIENATRVNGVELSSEQISQVQKTILNSQGKSIQGLHSYAYVGDNLMLYFSGKDGSNNDALFQVTINATKLTHIKGDQTDFNKEVVDYISNNNVHGVKFTASKGLVKTDKNTDSDQILSTALNFKLNGSNESATLEDVLFYIDTWNDQVPGYDGESTFVDYQVLVVNRDGTVTLKESGRLNILERCLEYEPAVKEFISDYLEKNVNVEALSQEQSNALANYIKPVAVVDEELE